MITYDPHHWQAHLLDIKGSMVRQIFSRVFLCVIWSAAVVYLYEFHCKGHEQWKRIAIAPLGHTLIGFALGLLLVFRTNASYDRFWEGRKMWGAIINETRNMGRAAGAYLGAAPDLVRVILGWTIGFSYATMHHLRDDKGLGPAADWLPARAVQATLEADHVPLATARRMSEQLAQARERGVISDYVQMALDQNIQLLMDYMGACERIHRTLLPFVYVVHLRRALILYCYTLPFALLDVFGWGTIAATMVIAYIMLGIEEIGVEIEDPFGVDDNDLPLEHFCATIERNLLGILGTLDDQTRFKSSSTE